MSGFYEGEDLDPMSTVESILVQRRRELNDYRRLFELNMSGFGDWSAHLMDKLIRWELDIQISCDFVDRSEDKLQVDLEERSLLEHESSFLPE
jgi:hypothetical protein